MKQQNNETLMKQKRNRKLKKYAFSGTFMLPALILYTVLLIFPVFFSVYYSFTKWDGIGAKAFIGLANYIKLFKAKEYWRITWNTVRMLFASVFIQIPIGTTLAYLLLRKTKGYKVFRALYFIPVVVAPMAIALMFKLFYNGDVGPINQFLRAVGLSSLAKNWLSDTKVVVNSVIFPQIWQYVGYTLVIVFAAMKSIDNEIIESAELDGANSAQMYFRIIIPMAWEAIVVAIVLVISGSLKSFDYSWGLTQGGPGTSSAMLAVYMYRTAFINNNFGLGSAISITIVVFSSALTYLFKKAANRD